VTIARKPVPGSATVCCIEHGTGALNIDGCRIGTSEALSRQNNSRDNAKGGRWPSNFILQHLPECECVGSKKVKPGNGSGVTGPGAHGFQTAYVGGETKATGFHTELVADWRCVEGCPVAELGGQSGVLKSPKPYVYRGKKSGGFTNGDIGQGIGHDAEFGDTGTAARFFKQVKP